MPLATCCVLSFCRIASLSHDGDFGNLGAPPTFWRRFAIAGDPADALVVVTVVAVVWDGGVLFCAAVKAPQFTVWLESQMSRAGIVQGHRYSTVTCCPPPGQREATAANVPCSHCLTCSDSASRAHPLTSVRPSSKHPWTRRHQCPSSPSTSSLLASSMRPPTVL